MKEFSLQVSKEFSTGLRRYHKARRQQGQFFDLFNLKPTKHGIVPFEPVVLPLSNVTFNGYGLDDETFPFPQIFFGKKVVLIACATRIFYVNPLDWTQLYLLDTYDAESPANTKDITVGNSWKFIDFWDSWFLTNGACTVFAPGSDTMMGNTFKVYVADSVPVSCGVDHKGRAVFGGFELGKFWNSTWQTFWQSWEAKNQDTGISGTNDYGYMPIGDQWIWWSSIGGGDVLQLFFPSLISTTGPLTTSGYDADKPFVLEQFKKNEQGFAPMPVQGKVQAIQPLGDFLIVFSDEGVTAIRPVANPAPTYSIKDLQLGGIANRGAVAGDDNHLIYLDNSGNLVRIPSNLDVEPLGFREYLWDMLGTDVLISHSRDPKNVDKFGEFYISNPGQHYGLTEEGLYEHGQMVTSVKFFQGTTKGMAFEVSNEQGRIGQDIIDFNLPGLKTVEAVRLAGRFWRLSDEGRSVSIALDYRYDLSDDDTWATTTYKTINKEGMAHFPITALEFRLRVRITNFEDMDLDYAEFFIKHGDKRYKRSVPFSQAFA